MGLVMSMMGLRISVVRGMRSWLVIPRMRRTLRWVRLVGLVRWWWHISKAISVLN